MAMFQSNISILHMGRRQPGYPPNVCGWKSVTAPRRAQSHSRGELELRHCVEARW
jgi:hypothetical protein